jgi:hypothetical protein
MVSCKTYFPSLLNKMRGEPNTISIHTLKNPKGYYGVVGS